MKFNVHQDIKKAETLPASFYKDKAVFESLFYSESIPFIAVFSEEMLKAKRKERADYPATVDFGKFGPPSKMLLGDDALEETALQVATGLKALNYSGVDIYYMAGNRDFLIGNDYAQKSGMQIINEPHVIDVNGEATLLIHGDAECTDDIPYQQARKMLRNPAWQTDFLSKSIPERIAFAEQARKQSQEHTQGADMDIMDVNLDAINSLFEQHNIKQMIHGHTHRPAIHESGNTRRIVLGDWHKQASYLVCDESDLNLVCT